MTGPRANHRRNSPVTSPSERTLVAIDIENLAGGPAAPQSEFARVWTALSGYAVRIRPGDLVIVGASRFAAKTAVFALNDAPVQWRWRDASGGADRAILDFIDLEHEARFRSRLVIASGNGVFASLALQGAALGMSTHLVLGRGGCSAKLWNACSTHAKLKLDQRRWDVAA